VLFQTLGAETENACDCLILIFESFVCFDAAVWVTERRHLACKMCHYYDCSQMNQLYWEYFQRRRPLSPPLLFNCNFICESGLWLPYFGFLSLHVREENL